MCYICVKVLTEVDSCGVREARQYRQPKVSIDNALVNLQYMIALLSKCVNMCVRARAPGYMYT